MITNNICIIICTFVATEQIKEVLAKDSQIRDLAEKLHKKKSLLIMGRGYNYATCLEGALVGTYTFTAYINDIYTIVLAHIIAYHTV